MLCNSWRHLCLARMAATAAAEFSQVQGTTAAGSDTVSDGPLLWVDDTVESREAYERHIRSPEYRELHRPALTTSAMGLFGGEPGFEKAHRVWVDPDRPQMKHIYNQTALAKNLRYSRYGYFKRDMHILDVDKLVRHARMLPTPVRLLSDFIYQRVPLPDRSSAAFLRYQRSQLEKLLPWERSATFTSAEEIFERLLVTNIPPVEVGVETHAEMIRCCAVCKEWEKGWSMYYQRATEVESESPGLFVLDTYFYDAVLELCVACERPREGMQIMEEVILRHLRPRGSMLEKTMILASIAAERLKAGAAEEPKETMEKKEEEEEDRDDKESLRFSFQRHGFDAWSLYDFFEIPRETSSVEAYMRMAAMYDEPELTLEALSVANTSRIRVSLECYHWLFYALRNTPGMADYVMDILSQLNPQGLTPDYLLFTLAFMYSAKMSDGELAVAIYTQHYIHYDLNPTPELVLLFLQSCTACQEPHIRMLIIAERLMERLEATGSSVDLTGEIYDQYMELASLLGAVGSAMSKIKKLVSLGKPLTTRCLNSLLLANSNAAPPNGGVLVTEEIVSLFRLLQIPANDDTIYGLQLCLEAFGTTDALTEWASALQDLRSAAPGQSLGEDGEIAVLDVPPHRLRLLKAQWAIEPRDIGLRRYGQYSKLPPKTHIGSMLGSVVPFGRTPGEKMI